MGISSYTIFSDNIFDVSIFKCWSCYSEQKIILFSSENNLLPFPRNRSWLSLHVVLLNQITLVISIIYLSYGYRQNWRIDECIIYRVFSSFIFTWAKLIIPYSKASFQIHLTEYSRIYLTQSSYFFEQGDYASKYLISINSFDEMIFKRLVSWNLKS